MPDCFTPAFRSEVMSRIRATHTKPEERLVAALLQVLGNDFGIERNVRSLPGCPDIVVPTLRVCVFADGCFFHGCTRHSRVPRSNSMYWRDKIQRNGRRDRRYTRMLRISGWSVWRVWEHDLTPSRERHTLARLRRSLAIRRRSLAATD